MGKRYSDKEREVIEQTLGRRLNNTLSDAYNRLSNWKSEQIDALEDEIRSTPITRWIDRPRWDQYSINFGNNRGNYTIYLRATNGINNNPRVTDFEEKYKGILDEYNEKKKHIDDVRAVGHNRISEFILRLVMGEDINEVSMPKFDDLIADI